nr:outer membrane protein assembly factor BamC [Gammaproteobacteria bacterium]
MFKRNRKYLILGAVILVVTGCGGSSERGDKERFYGQEAEYRESRSLPPLEVPPDLMRPAQDGAFRLPEDAGADGTTTYSDYASASVGKLREPVVTEDVLPPVSGARVERSGTQRWLAVDAPPSEVWPKLRGFWVENGLTIEREDPDIGIMETNWAENRANIPEGGIRGLFEKFTPSVYSSATRDKFRTRLERGAEPDTTEIYVSHRGAEEVSQGDSFVWQPRPSDAGLEAEMLYRMLVYFGTKPQEAQQQLASTVRSEPGAKLVRDETGTVLELDDNFARGWQRTGVALDRVGFTVTDRDRSQGIYYVRYADPAKDIEKKGFLSKLKFWGEEDDAVAEQADYLVRLNGAEGAPLALVVLDVEGKRETSQTADRILSLLYEQLK